MLDSLWFLGEGGMTGKQNLGLGLLCGVALGVLACVALLVWTGERLEAAQIKAYEDGREAGVALMRGEGDAISLALNEGLMQSNADMSAQIDEAIKLLMPISSNLEIPQDALASIQAALATLEK